MGFSNAFGVATILLAGAPAAALAQNDFAVRNDTSRTFTCGLQTEDRSTIDRFVLRAGGQWRVAAGGQGVRTLRCDTHAMTPRWPMRSGAAYALVEDPQSGRIVLRELRPAS